jgi:hypothetical protein
MNERIDGRTDEWINAVLGQDFALVRLCYPGTTSEQPQNIKQRSHLLYIPAHRLYTNPSQPYTKEPTCLLGTNYETDNDTTITSVIDTGALQVHRQVRQTGAQCSGRCRVCADKWQVPQGLTEGRIDTNTPGATYKLYEWIFKYIARTGSWSLLPLKEQYILVMLANIIHTAEYILLELLDRLDHIFTVFRTNSYTRVRH